MSGTDEDRKALTRRLPAPTYDIGYGKPPVHSRFKPGRSGNPKGRRKGSRNKPKLPALNEERLKSVILEEAYRTITIGDAAGRATIPMAQAVVRSIAVKAAKGNSRAQRLFTQILGATEKENKRLHDEWLDVAMTYKIEWDRELRRREELGIGGPEPLPHPDHIVIDMNTGQVRITGPMTKEEKAEHETWLARRAMFEEELVELEDLLKDPDCSNRDLLLEEIVRTEKVLEIIGRALGTEVAAA